MIISYFFGDRRLNRANERKIGLILYKIRCGYNYKQHIWSDFYFFFSFLGLKKKKDSEGCLWSNFWSWKVETNPFRVEQQPQSRR